MFMFINIVKLLLSKKFFLGVSQSIMLFNNNNVQLYTKYIACTQVVKKQSYAFFLLHSNALHNFSTAVVQ